MGRKLFYLRLISKGHLRPKMTLIQPKISGNNFLPYEFYKNAFFHENRS